VPVYAHLMLETAEASCKLNRFDDSILKIK